MPNTLCGCIYDEKKKFNAILNTVIFPVSISFIIIIFTSLESISIH